MVMQTEIFIPTNHEDACMMVSLYQRLDSANFGLDNLYKELIGCSVFDSKQIISK